MGGQRFYKSEGGFSEYLYRHVGENLSINGLNVRTVEYMNTKDHHEPKES